MFNLFKELKGRYFTFDSISDVQLCGVEVEVEVEVRIVLMFMCRSRFENIVL